jgi:CxxC motif-containing protein
MNEQRKLTCIQCPNGCQLIAELKNGYVVSVTGNQCPRGETYAKQEVENPQRIITSTITGKNLSVSKIPVKTTLVPKSKISELMKIIHAFSIDYPVQAGEIISANLGNTGVALIATRTVDRE